jgi:RHS repeat-associated protein
VSATYGYNGYGELTNSNSTLNARDLTWAYDLAGNRQSETGTGTTTYSTANTNANAHGSLNQYESITGTNGEASLSYDADGNLTQDGTWTYAYDGENRLKQMTKSGQTLTFTYDYMNRRIRKTVTGSSASDTKFLWSGWKLAADLSADGFTVNRVFVWGPDFSDAHGNAGGAGSLLAQISGTSISYAVPDVLGNIVGYANGSGSMIAAVEYSPYGHVVSAMGSNASHPIGYSGQYTDWETGLVYYGMRYYTPKHGRFVNRDPIEETGGNNLYGFCGNNSVNRWDVLGMYDERGNPTNASEGYARAISTWRDIGATTSRPPSSGEVDAYVSGMAFGLTWQRHGDLMEEIARINAARNSGTVTLPPTAYQDSEGNWRSLEDDSLINGGDGYAPNSAATPAVGSKEWHYARNQLNDAGIRQRFGDAAIDDKNFRFNNDLLKKNGFVQAPAKENIFHEWGPGTEGNKKWTLSEEGRRWGSIEIIVRADGSLETNPKVMGTYNYGGNATDHWNLDVYPYLKWGNSPDDPTTAAQRWGRLLFH